ncbi:hypothetical protein HRG_014901 [Hirsutella rhossiliensis]
MDIGSRGSQRSKSAIPKQLWGERPANNFSRVPILGNLRRPKLLERPVYGQLLRGHRRQFYPSETLPMLCPPQPPRSIQNHPYSRITMFCRIKTRTPRLNPVSYLPSILFLLSRSSPQARLPQIDADLLMALTSRMANRALHLTPFDDGLDREEVDNSAQLKGHQEATDFSTQREVR